jgi:hypothetical protein
MKIKKKYNKKQYKNKMKIKKGYSIYIYIVFFLIFLKKKQ